MVRIYLTEGEHLLSKVVERLHDEEKVWGLTVFRGISGFGKKGHMHTSRLVDLSLDLPLVIEFFDEPERAQRVIEHLVDTIDPQHIVSWPATLAANGNRNHARSQEDSTGA